MSEKEINEMFAQFLGWFVAECYVTPTDKDIKCLNLDTEFKEIPPYTMKFHCDWNWLMLVVDKIENVHNKTVLIERQKCHIHSGGTHHGVSTKVQSKIEAVYNACAEFVQWYNKQQK